MASRCALDDMNLISVYSIDGAEQTLYELLRERSTEDDPYVNISHRQLPTWNEHVKFFDSKPYRYWYLIYLGLTALGTVYASKRNEIGIVLFRAHRGQGHGTQAVAMLVDKHKPLKAIPGVRSGKYLANINPNNTASIKLFESIGFKHLSNTYEL
jgi:RimJ/RimL family protein N-acetyltransferase